MKVGDLVKFKATGVTVVYLGFVNGLYQFYDTKYGRIELMKEHRAGKPGFNMNKKMELVSASR